MNLSLELHRRRSLCDNLPPSAPLEPLSALQQCLAGDLRIAVRRQDDLLHLRTLDGDPCTLEYADGYRINRLLRGLEHVTAQHWQELNLSLCRNYMSIDCRATTPVVRGLISASLCQQQVLQDLTAFFNLSSAAKQTVY
ncbi:hypothetical protein [Pseudomonas asplenii]|uniref:Tir chaperone protein (CesT) family n=1 Tax=Pseudomonas asplenii TaxID=53407 RepID=A0A1H6N1V1_9PSED|nr:hypothetical protein [Pseudomonas fuscovaginae]SEI05293.1 hypothetical protein SAMN05216581_1592 [Pseudomonas fuscovaginae]